MFSLIILWIYLSLKCYWFFGLSQICLQHLFPMICFKISFLLFSVYIKILLDIFRCAILSLNIIYSDNCCGSNDLLEINLLSMNLCLKSFVCIEVIWHVEARSKIYVVSQDICCALTNSNAFFIWKIEKLISDVLFIL